MSRQTNLGRAVPALDKSKPGADDTKIGLEQSDMLRITRVAKATEDAAVNMIPAGVMSVVVTGVTTDANDFIVLPALADVPNGSELTIICSAGANFELRTPASSNEEINSEDCDGTKEYLCTDTQIVKVIKINNTIGWMAHGYSAIGAVVTAVVPD